MDHHIGVDVGGTAIKACIADASGAIVTEMEQPTGAERPQDVVLQDIVAVVRQLLAGPIGRDVRTVGVGCPGAVLPDEGLVLYNNNLDWRDFPLGPLMEEALGLPVRVENDANVAALGEVVAGSAKGASSAAVITLGTGVGFGLIIDGAIWTGHNGAASEFGHMVIVKGGRACTCGRRGCLEAYASATGLIAMTEDAIAAHPRGAMAVMARREGRVGGHTAFVAAKMGDAAAAAVVEEYIDCLACGVANIIDGLQPEVVSIGGGVSRQGEALLAPLREKVATEVYAGLQRTERATRIVGCTLGHRAGLVGAAMAAAHMMAGTLDDARP